MTDTLLEYTFDDSLHDVLRAGPESGPSGIDSRSGAVVVLAYSDVERLAHDPRLAGSRPTLTLRPVGGGGPRGRQPRVGSPPE